MGKIKFSKKHISQFKKIGVETIYLFGSRAHGNAGQLSDFDFGVVLENPKTYDQNPLDIYSIMYNILIDVLPKNYLHHRFKTREHEFDLVFLQYAPISLQFAAIKVNEILYQKDQEKRLFYEEYVIKEHADLQYFYDLHSKAILERI